MKLDENLTTPRLLIRSYRDADQEFCLSLWGDAENGRYMSDPLRENVTQAYLDCFTGMENDPEGYYLIAELRETGAPVGTCCIFPEPEDNYDIGYCVSKDHWRAGLGSELLQALIAQIRRFGGRSVTGEVADRNDASVALLKKHGFAAVRATQFKKWGEDKVFDAHVYRLEL